MYVLSKMRQELQEILNMLNDNENYVGPAAEDTAGFMKEHLA